jgi:hypothetical protein
MGGGGEGGGGGGEAAAAGRVKQRRPLAGDRIPGSIRFLAAPTKSSEAGAAAAAAAAAAAVAVVVVVAVCVLFPPSCIENKTAICLHSTTTTRAFIHQAS